MCTTLLDVDYTDLDQQGNKVALSYYLNLTFKRVDEEWLLIHDQNTIHSKQS